MSKWKEERLRKYGEVRGRKAIYGEPLEPYAIKLPIQQVEYLDSIPGADGRSHALRSVLLSYRDAGDGIVLDDYERGSYTVRRTGYSLPKAAVEVADDAGSGAYMVGMRMIIKGAIDGKFDVALCE